MFAVIQNFYTIIWWKK